MIRMIRMTRKIRWRTWLFALFLGCPAESAETEVATVDLVEGAPCHWQDAMCIDDADVLHCHEGEWTQQSCTEYCGSIGHEVTSVGCNAEPSQQSSHPMDRPDLLCACTPAADGCHPGEARCDSDDTLEWCATDWTWHNSSCDALCADRSLLSLGCGSFENKISCLCTNLGMACAGDTSVCSSDAALAVCEHGVWAERQCSDVCGGPGSCEPGQWGGAACRCDT